MMEINERKFKGVWVCKFIWLHPKLTWMEKCLFAEIDSLDDEEKGCTASNAYLAKMFNTSAASIANMLTRLRAEECIETAGFDGRRRSIRVKADLTHRLRQGQPTGEPSINPQVNPEGRTNKDEILAKKENCISPKEQEPQEPSPTRRFTDAWCAAYLQKYGAKYPFNGRDGKATAELLKVASPDELISMVRRAWEKTDEKRFWSCIKQTSSVSKFLSALSTIRVELSRENSISRPEPAFNPAGGNFT